ESLDGRARLTFRRGQVIDARFDSLDGAAAVNRMLMLTEGEYSVAFGPVMGRASLSYGLHELIAGAFARLPRWQKLRTASVPLDARLQVDFAQLSRQIGAIPDRVNDL